ncbi:MAG: DEAD/DEAH box helicase [Promethearchaeota archaeon]
MVSESSLVNEENKIGKIRNKKALNKENEENGAIMHNNYVNDALLVKDKILHRDYQVNIAGTAFGRNTLVVLPTALGKTIIAILVAVRSLKEYKGSKILVLAPTKPLVMQHLETFKKFIVDKIPMASIIGNVPPLKRALLINNSRIIFSTPQIIKNDLDAGRYDLGNFSLLIFDEAHKARKNYAYTFLALKYMQTAKKPYILALTASPGKDKENINLLIQKLYIERVCFRTENNVDVKDYIFPIDIIQKEVYLSNQITSVQSTLKKAINGIVNYFVKEKILPAKDYYSKVDFLRLMADLKTYDEFGENSDYEMYHFPDILDKFSGTNIFDNKKFTYIRMATAAIYFLHMEEILTTQDPRLFIEYYEKLKDRAKYGKKSASWVINSKFFKSDIDQKIDALKDITNPKIRELDKIIAEVIGHNPKSKLIVFTQYRDMANIILKHLEANKDLMNALYKKNKQLKTDLTEGEGGADKERHKVIRPVRFIGQYSKPGDRGLSQKQQKQIIDEFKEGVYNILIATSIAEEGLDIPNVDAVVFYEPVPSEIRLIQRRGRTGRFAPGKCFILYARNTLDEIYLQVSFRKEANMYRTLINENDLELMGDIKRSSEPFFVELKDDNDIINFFKKIEERKKMTLKLQISTIKEITGSEAHKEYKKEVEKYGIKDLTDNIAKSSLTRLERKEESIRLTKEEKMKERYERRRQNLLRSMEKSRQKRLEKYKNRKNSKT